MKITYQQVEQNIASIANRSTYTADFLYELLAAYGRSATSITQLKSGTINKVSDSNAILQKDVVYFKVFPKDTVLEHEVEKIEEDPLTGRYRPRYIIATDLIELRAKDTKKNTTLAVKIADLDKDIAFFYGWTGDEITDNKTEAVADRRAADKMNELYSEIEKVNFEKFAKEGNTFRHDLNVFFSRLLFCFFAEDTGLFTKNQFANAIKLITNTDGSDLNIFFVNLFKALDSEDKSTFSTPYSDFPFVNGTIFNTDKHNITVPDFNAQARHLLLECTKSDWGEINPDIFGTMFQGIVDPEKRDHNGMDYTSVPNIMKVIEPLFLDELHERFDGIYNTPNELKKLLARIRNIKVFDPACGSGNFLIIAYKQLRLLESAILSRLDELKKAHKKSKTEDTREALFTLENVEFAAVIYDSEIPLNNFYGIEIDDFAHEMAILSLYIAKHQMDAEFEKQFPVKLKHLPLIKNENIIKGNATRLDWNDICKNNGNNEIYIISNPPYLGQRNQEEQHKADLAFIFSDDKSGKYKKMDYVCCWFMKGAEYISGTIARLAYISTNSVTQGVQIEQLWPRLFSKDIEIKYAHRPFKWKNNARDVAGVFVVAISLGNKINNIQKYIYDGSLRTPAKNINPYLIDGDNIIIEKTKMPLNGFHKMIGGCQPREGGYLMLSDSEKNELIKTDFRVEKFILPMVGSTELLNGIPRWCIWIEDNCLEEAQNIPALKDRIEKVKQHRINGNSVERTFVNVPWKFVTTKRPKESQIIIPAVTTSARKYIPIGLLDRSIIVNSRAYCLFDAELYYFSILSSVMHNAWVKTVSGRLGDAINYSSNICYNTFPIPSLSDEQKAKLTASARAILLARDAHFEQTLAEMYDPEKMPADLREAHEKNDIIVDQLYRGKGFANDEDRLATLFDLYEQMTVKKGKK